MQATTKTKRERSHSSLHRTAKRVIDIILSAVALVVLAPLFAIIALLIRLDSPGPVFFRQKRVGRSNSRFTCLKFRTMYQDADQRVHKRAIERLAAGEPIGDDPASPYKMTRDARVTRTGRWLRKTSLDELPQLMNVLRGEMSLVGPRPAIPYELEFYEEWQHARHFVKPGITGLWQVFGRSTATMEEMIQLDIEYARNWSIWLDIKLIILTIPVVLSRRGAH